MGATMRVEDGQDVKSFYVSGIKESDGFRILVAHEGVRSMGYHKGTFYYSVQPENAESFRKLVLELIGGELSIGDEPDPIHGDYPEVLHEGRLP